MLFSVVAISCLLAVQATPLSYGVGMEGSVGMGMSDEMGIGRGIGEVHSGSKYGHRRREGGSRGYGSREYETEGGSSSHNRGHLDRDYKEVVQSHVSEGHDVGHSEGHRSRGHERGEHNRHEAGESAYGGRFHSEIGI